MGLLSYYEQLVKRKKVLLDYELEDQDSAFRVITSYPQNCRKSHQGPEPPFLLFAK